MNNAQQYIEVIKKVRSLNYTQNQTACGIAMLDDDQPFDIINIVNQIIDNIKRCNKIINVIATYAKQATIKNAGDAITKIIKLINEFALVYPDLNATEIFNHLLNILAGTNSNDFKKCFLIAQAIDLDYYHKLIIKKWN